LNFIIKNTPCPTSTLDPPIEKKEEAASYKIAKLTTYQSPLIIFITLQKAGLSLII